MKVWEFLCRFSDILGQKEPPSLEDLEEIVVDASEVDNGFATYRKGKFFTQVSGIPLDALAMICYASQNMHLKHFELVQVKSYSQNKGL